MEIISDLNIADLLSKGEYRIPIYQRNYAWGIPEVTQLIQDITDYAKENENDNYYIGTLVVFPHEIENYFETIDGQQRCTTLTLIACSIKKHYKKGISWYNAVNISFDHREHSNETLQRIFKQEYTQPSTEKINSEIIAVYNNVWRIIEKTCNDKGLDIDKFVEYLFSKVIILRIGVPADTDLNHYFEILNSRGEQLEQHEIVKALLMSALKDSHSDMYTFNYIWNACSNMSRYVQMNIDKSIRNYLFTENGIDKVISDFERLSSVLGQNNENLTNKSLLDLFKDDLNKETYAKPWEEQDSTTEQIENFSSIINFPNFLLHVLKVLNPQKGIILDDKKLIQIFKGCYDSSEEKQKFVKEFILGLLKIRYLFDKYIIKRKYEKWSLKQLLTIEGDRNSFYYGGTFKKLGNEIENKERDVIMLQAMFHVSLPTQTHKHWLNAALSYVYNATEITSQTYSEYLWLLAKSYMLDRYLAKTKSKSFEEIIYKNNGKPQNGKNDIDWGNINIENCKMVGECVDNFVFNFYDYILYKEHPNEAFEFSYRTSVEHFYPQHPIDKNKEMDFIHLHSFGNLCLVSNSINSKFSNNLPAAKYSNFGADKERLKSFSLKLQNMMRIVANEKWDEESIEKETTEAKKLLKKYLDIEH